MLRIYLSGRMAIEADGVLVTATDFPGRQGRAAFALLVGERAAPAHHIARRPFLPGDDGVWIGARRQKLASILIRALECRAEVYLWNGEHALAIEAAREAVALHPFRETGYRLLMRAHTAAGNAAEALQVYEQCRQLISAELGVRPSPETKAVYEHVLQLL